MVVAEITSFSAASLGPKVYTQRRTCFGPCGLSTAIPPTSTTTTTKSTTINIKRPYHIVVLQCAESLLLSIPTPDMCEEYSTECAMRIVVWEMFYLRMCEHHITSTRRLKRHHQISTTGHTYLSLGVPSMMLCICYYGGCGSSGSRKQIPSEIRP